VDSDVAAVVARLEEQAALISDALCTAVEDNVPELPRDDGMSELMRNAIRDHLQTVLHALLHVIDVTKLIAPATHIEYSRALARHNIPVHAMMRGHRLGQRRLTELLFAELPAFGMAPARKAAVIQTLTRALLKYVDVVSQQALTAYQGERKVMLEAQRIVRDMQVQDVLDYGRSLDVDAISTAISYPLSWQHLALIVWYPGGGTSRDGSPRLQDFVRELAAAVDASVSPLLAGADPAAGWVWLPYRSVPGDAVTRIREFVRLRPDAPNVAIGAMGCGVEGFRRSHRQAQRAREAVRARGVQQKVVVAATDAGIVDPTLLDVGVVEVREWVADVLGPLASDTDDDARLRETLRVLLDLGSGYKAAAQKLDMPLRAVAYNVAQAVARRGRPIDDKRNVELALLACQRYGAAVLRPGRD
jgi:DNA-binding PucR family transcriptional regulator